jgi:hypothetical protein
MTQDGRGGLSWIIGNSLLQGAEDSDSETTTALNWITYESTTLQKTSEQKGVLLFNKGIT